MAASLRCVREVTVFSSNQRSPLVDFSIGTKPTTKIRDEETVKCNIGGGYGYRDSYQTYSVTSNRFIHWRIRENILELTEQSLDVNLSGNCLRLMFLGGTLVSGLSIFETPTSVCILVATTNSVHRIVFTHPNRLQGHVLGLSSSYDQNLSSIFNTTTIAELREPWNFATLSQCCLVSTAWLCQDGHTLFALATEIGSILLVKLPPNGIHEEAEQFELQQSSMMQRLWSGLVPSSLRGDSPLPDGIVDLQLQPLGKQMCIFTLCRDHKLRIWSCQKQECICIKDLLEDVPDDVDVSTVTAQNHMLRMTVDPKTDRLYVGVFLSFQYQNQFCVYEALADGHDIYLSPVSYLYSPLGSLVDFTLTSSDIWTQWTTNDGESVTLFTNFENGVQSESGWNKVLSPSNASIASVVVPSYKEPKEVYLDELFYPGHFSDQAIIKALQIYQSSNSTGLSSMEDRSELKKQVINLIDTELTIENKTDIDNDLKYKCNPALIAQQIADTLVTNGSDDYQQTGEKSIESSEFMQEIETSLQKVSNLFECFDVIVRSLDLSEIQMGDNGSESPQIGNQPKFGSHFMHSVLASSFQQTMETHMSMCRDFLVFLVVVDRLGSRAGVDPRFSQDISSVYIPQVVVLLRVYHCLHWLTELEVTPAPSNAIESNLKQLAALEISDGIPAKLVQGTDDVLMQNFLQADSSSKESLTVLFYVKVMRLFEQFEVPDMVIYVANTAVSTAMPDDPNIPNLWSNIFKHHLQLGHNDQAYAALISNPDPSRKRDCLHRFMVVLCERGQLQELCEYPYVNLHDEFVDIMESHARTIDIATHQYYDLLYAFHVFRGNYRKAGSVMYEYGGRLGRELPGKNGLQKQAKCYLAAINALQLVDPKNAWIVTPWDRAQKKKAEEPPNTSPKRKQGDEDLWYGMDRRERVPRKLSIVEIKDLEKDYLLVLARLQLLRLDTDPSQGTGPPLTPDETMTLVIQAGLFDTAFTVASAFNLPRDSIFEGLTARCVRQSYNNGMTRAGMLDNKETWQWLLENDTGNTQPSHDKSVADQAWKLLQSYLDKLKKSPNGRVYYRCVASKLLTMGAPLPTWLMNEYKRLNPAELLYLLVTYDMLQEAADFAIEYINAVLGEGKEYFGLKTGLHATMPSVWLPYTTLDHLLSALDGASPHSNLAQMHEKLVDKLERYHEQVERVSEDMITTAWKRAQRRTAAESLPWQ
ncbi:hypothetical protein QZH41_012989 [Actinostola sp. cb2023]|nr:hypothetical protein QZH41_012989 [Actinostola sp. cb2023]